MKIAVIGTGYVGLVSGTCFAELGHEVVCVDKVAEKITRLEQGIIPIYEPGLEEMVARNVQSGRLRFTTDIASAVQGAQVVSIAVGTPSRIEDGHADLRYVYSAAEDIARAMDGYAVVVTKSTVPVGTGREIEAIIAKARPELEFDVASNPEFLREGNAVEDFMDPQRVVVGTTGARAKGVMQELYQPLSDRGAPVFFTDLASSELIKYAANTFLAAKITFINEMSDLCEALGANVMDVAHGMGTDDRIGPKFLAPGPGYGGSCFPKDTLAMVKIGEKAGNPITIIEAVCQSNDARKHRMVEKIVSAAGGEVKGKRIALLGLTFKPNTDDVRDSSALVIAEDLVGRGATITAYDPKGMEEARHLLGDSITYAVSTDEALKGADLAVLVTEWKEFCNLAPAHIKSLLKAPVFIDLRNVFEPAVMAKEGFVYVSIGRAAVNLSMRASEAA